MPSVSLEGLADLEAALADLPQRIAKGAVRRSLRRGAEVIKARAVELAPAPGSDHPFATGKLKENIAVSSQASGRGGRRQREDANEALAYVGPTGKAYPEAMMVEMGTVHMGAMPYLRPAWEEKKEEALRVIADDLGPEITKTAARYAKRLARAGG